MPNDRNDTRAPCGQAYGMGAVVLTDVYLGERYTQSVRATSRLSRIGTRAWHIRSQTPAMVRHAAAQRRHASAHAFISLPSSWAQLVAQESHTSADTRHTAR